MLNCKATELILNEKIFKCVNNRALHLLNFTIEVKDECKCSYMHYVPNLNGHFKTFKCKQSLENATFCCYRQRKPPIFRVLTLFDVIARR